MTDTTTTESTASSADQPIGTLEHLDPTLLDIGDNVRQLTTNPQVMLCSILSGALPIPNFGCPKSSASSSAKGSNQRTAPFSRPGQRNSTVPGFDATLAGLVGVSK